jgi:DNA-binding CsgD family transcriptional regulator
VLESLTTRETEVLRLLAQGLPKVRSPNGWSCGAGTTKYQVKNILRKLGSTGRADGVSRNLRATGMTQS